jgi:hypothetical protein
VLNCKQRVSLHQRQTETELETEGRRLSLLYVRARGYVVHESFDILYAQCDEIARMLSGIIEGN